MVVSFQGCSLLLLLVIAVVVVVVIVVLQCSSSSSSSVAGAVEVENSYISSTDEVLLLLLLLLVQSLIPNTNRSVKPSLVDATRSHEAGVALDALPQEVLSCLQLPTTESQAIKF